MLGCVGKCGPYAPARRVGHPQQINQCRHLSSMLSMGKRAVLLPDPPRAGSSSRIPGSGEVHCTTPFPRPSVVVSRARSPHDQVQVSTFSVIMRLLSALLAPLAAATLCAAQDPLPVVSVGHGTQLSGKGLQVLTSPGKQPVLRIYVPKEDKVSLCYSPDHTEACAVIQDSAPMALSATAVAAACL